MWFEPNATIWPSLDSVHGTKTRPGKERMSPCAEWLNPCGLRPLTEWHSRAPEESSWTNSPPPPPATSEKASNDASASKNVPRSSGPSFIHKNPYDIPGGDTDDDDGENDEGNVMACLNAFAHAVKSGPKLSQRQRKAQPGPPRLTKKQIQDIVHKTASGQIKLPDLQPLHDDDLTSVWALLDAGSAVHVVEFAKHLPGIKIRESKAQRHGVKYLCAGGARIPNKGEGVAKFQTEDGQDKSMVFQNAEVGMPVMSTNGVAVDWNAEITYGADKGHVTMLANGKRTNFIMRDGVYFIEMRVPRKVAQEPPPPGATHPRPERGFHGHA